MRHVYLLGFLFTVIPLVSPAQEIEVQASKDNTLYESAAGNESNGAGMYFFAGTTNSGDTRRALLMFDVASAVPEGAVVESARLELNMSRTVASAVQVSLHRVLADWGEAGSNASVNEGSGAPAQTGDATWIHRFFSSETWQNPGGDFAEETSSSTEVSGTGTYTWESTPAMLADIQSWIDNPEENFGWIIIGNETASRTAKRFDTRENPTEGNRPRLFLTLSTNTAVESDVLPVAALLEDAWPNPFSRSTQVGFQLERDAEVELEVFDVTGRRVADLVDGWLPAGRHEVAFTARNLPAGLYVSRLTTTGPGGLFSVATRTLVLTR